jgi:hypothetical protein
MLKIDCVPSQRNAVSLFVDVKVSSTLVTVREMIAIRLKVATTPGVPIETPLESDTRLFSTDVVEAARDSLVNAQG